MKVTSGNFRRHISWKQSLVDGRSTVRNQPTAGIDLGNLLSLAS